MLQIIKHINSLFSSNTYIIYDKENNSFWLIDPGDTEDIFSIIKDGYLKGVLLTHTHYDHIYGLNKIINQYPGILVYTNGFGKKALSNPSDNLSLYHGDKFVVDSRARIVCLSKHNKICINSGKYMSVFETPGHDKSCLCYILDNTIFTGDSYIPGLKVFTKLQNGDYKMAEQSLKEIENISRGKMILPGHDYRHIKVEIKSSMNLNKSDSTIVSQKQL